MDEAQSEPQNSLLDFQTQHSEVFSDRYVSKVSHPHSSRLSAIIQEAGFIVGICLLAVTVLLAVGFSVGFSPILWFGLALFIIIAAVIWGLNRHFDYTS